MSQQTTIVGTTISHAESMVALAAAIHPVPLLDDVSDPVP